MEEHVGRKLPIKMRLEKRIPVGGGLGGGSSNAAAMLRALNELFDLKLSRETLRDIAARLGSDVPFLIDGGSAIVTGLGEQLEPTAQGGHLLLAVLLAAPRHQLEVVHHHKLHPVASSVLADDRSDLIAGAA